MTLSLCYWALGSSMWSVFWNADVPCNSVGPWIAPIAAVLEPIINDNDMELLAQILSLNNATPLWLGVALCGRRAIIHSILPSLIELQDYPHFRPSIDAAAWTGLAQSFMDYHQTRPVMDGTVSRADVWRLRHDCSDQYYPDTAFSYTPPYGWPPFGRMRVIDVELEIRRHLTCSHEWKYTYWTWSLSDLTDAGFSNAEIEIRKRAGYVEVNLAVQK
ncbi:hypothetical protein XA68_12054 [Ophiocordyceps unilateralis]|uniref:Uncharacterized protein n=1 Tax=Ophiocordyceps unilateralis TaxID=268505 RepID=A0A0L9T0Q3_OPHUN|nr:hypothetical protein XA68_18477 [Ophiocordyceps unilateralis]PFH59649.1 hypothetical protein XA68_12054 [Ophiocordyceps unilateralis]